MQRAGHPLKQAVVLVGKRCVDDVVAFLHLVDEFPHLMRRMLPVIVHHDDCIAGRIAKASHDRSLLAEIAGHVHTDDLRIRFTKRTDHTEGTVGRTVVDEDDLIIPAFLPGDGLPDLTHHSFDGLFRAVARNNY